MRLRQADWPPSASVRTSAWLLMLSIQASSQRNVALAKP
jgi:hypothetical protein